MTLIYFILILSITIFIHELGHFIFAKKAGIYVYEFSIGMGPRIFKYTRKNDETEYGIRLFPIGGFCSLVGESVEIDKNIPEDKRLQSKTWKERFLTVVAGVMFNFIFALIILFIVGLINGNPSNKPLVSSVLENSSSQIAGLKAGDMITEINGVKVKTSDRLLIEYQVEYGKDLNLKVLRDKKEESITIKPTKKDNGYEYGFSLDNTINKGFFEAIKYSFSKFLSLVEQMIVVISYLFTGKLSLSTLSGPVGIYSIVGESAKAGLINIVYLMGYLSLNLGFMNLLPIPAFDGGRLIFLIIEKIRKKPVNPNLENTIHSIGMVLLMILMIAITYNDIIRLFK